jgi:hypothetical protein
VARATAAAFDALERALPRPVAFISMRTWPAHLPTHKEAQRRSPYEARADAIMYRQVVADVAHARGWGVHLYVAKDVLGQAADILGERTEAVIDGPRATLGPPWTKDHRIALAAAIVAGAPG